MKTQIQKFKILLLLLMSATLLTSCSSDDDGGNTQPTAAELLANKWYIVKTEDHSVDPPVETIADECQQNIYYSFLPDGVVVAESFFYNVEDVCESGGVEAGTYDISADGDQIYLSSGAPPTILVLTIELLTSEELIMSQGNQKLFFTK